MANPRPELPPLLKVCALLNESGARYLIIGGQAVILHGFVRTTGYSGAISSALEVTIDGVRVPYLGWGMLIASKQTYREKDQLDLLQLHALKERQ
jgi:hypothetical protein